MEPTQEMDAPMLRAEAAHFARVDLAEAYAAHIERTAEELGDETVDEGAVEFVSCRH